MLMAVTILSLLSHLSGATLYRTCVPNTHYVLNGRLCFCDRNGHWNDLNCHKVERRQICQPGQIIWEDCSQCICQDNGNLVCTNSACDGYDGPSINREEFDTSPSCTPFRSYYVNCTLCVCPASGRTRDARCATDKSCTLKRPPSASDLVAGNTLCIPKVMYLFQCLHCLCSDEGKFATGNCVEMCYKGLSEPSKRCIPRSFYRKDCNICRCPATGVPNDQLCTSDVCTNKSKFNSLNHLKNRSSVCVPHEFTKPKCIYCDCNTDGKINSNACLELECLKTNNFPNDLVKTVCNPGEVFPICMECFCPRTGVTVQNYCTEGCTLHHKLAVLETVLKESLISRIIEKELLKTLNMNEKCDPNSLYLDQGRFCLCSENGNTNFKLCTSVTDKTTRNATFTRNSIEPKSIINSNMSCEPNTFVDIDCNTCYCGKNGKIDPKWCTYDDCEAKRITREKNMSPLKSESAVSIDTCIPGYISRNECNHCICPESGLLKNRVCTKNNCKGHANTNVKFACEPLTYYQVDCNICYCPRDGLKNVAKCTKHECEKNFLRSDFCISGELFSDDCNICVCPPNGEKVGKVCTNYTCSELDTPWKKIFTISQNLLGANEPDEIKRGLDLCFPGEEFRVGCKLCICPDMGLREYAQCTTICDENSNDSLTRYKRQNNFYPAVNNRRSGKKCITTNLTKSEMMTTCTPGSTYIVRCQVCTCPYMGPLILFCRPMTVGDHCEEAFPYIQYEPILGRRHPDESLGNTSTTTLKTYQITEHHEHTLFTCKKAGEVRSECYLCHCEHGTLIEEHCYKKQADNCTNAELTFLDRKNKIVLE